MRTKHEIKVIILKPETASWLFSLTVSRHVVPRELLEVGGFKPLLVPVHRPHHAGPRLLEHLLDRGDQRRVKAGGNDSDDVTETSGETVLTRYPSLGPSSSSPDSFRMAGTTPKNGNVCGAEREGDKSAGRRSFVTPGGRGLHGSSLDPEKGAQAGYDITGL